MKYLFVFLLTSVVAIACTPQPTQSSGGNKMKRLETLHTVDPQESFIGITVTGHGCTAAEHFKIQVARNNDKCQVSIYRTQLDFCRRMPMPISLELPWNAEEACGDTAIEIVNPQKQAASSFLRKP